MKMLLAVLLITMTILTSSALALASEDVEPTGTAILMDIVVVRPLSLAGLVIGAGVFIVALPFTLSTASMEVAQEKLLFGPFRAFFKRPVGDIHDERGYQ